MMPPRSISPILSRSSKKTTTTTEDAEEDDESVRKHPSGGSKSERRVHFAANENTLDNENCCYGSLSRSDYSEEEREACWYTSDERRSMHRQQDISIHCLETGIVREANAAFQGLEIHTTIGKLESKLRKYDLMDAIMEEQENQCAHDRHTIDWDRYAAISLRGSEESKAIAFETAEKHQMEAFNVYANDNNNSEDNRRIEALPDRTLDRFHHGVFRS